ncbi:MAG TPA: DUF3078 domain-containing protein [Bacteroidales bacterium]|nr:DUF3078 domain-containing protein [Bacteroidales bacterium]
MRTKAAVFSLATILSIALHAQDQEPKPWKCSGKVGFNFSQSHLSNWAAGGQSALNSLALFRYDANYAKNQVKFDNNIDINLGYSLIGKLKPIKTDDKIEINSSYGRKATEKIYYSTAFSFKSQLRDGFNYAKDSTNPISKIFSPAYITLGFGGDWKPSEAMSFTWLPLTGRLTIVADDSLSAKGAFGVEAGKKLKTELGSKATIRFKKEIFTNVTLTSKLELFSDYLKNPQNIDIDFQNLIVMKVNSWMNANISAHLIYDNNIKITDKDGKTGPRTQFKEVLSIGLSHAF